EDGIRDGHVTGVQTCALPILPPKPPPVVNPSYLAKVPAFQGGGTVPGIGPILGLLHGGETVTPAGGGGNITVIEHHSHVHLDDRSEERRVGKECGSWWSPYE